ncbi:hypothetical protein GGQ64_004230 [Rhizobium azooxidifex]|uniref:Polymerase nucleotidyl transferase domain-containing protein n=1 Tax=Mycoplana azooxidifex TaxID=1636188 RepID=A0A7W6GMH9_9HYPH|nr:nucleotidyltransferase domain-containing protein [Mycoplana azooxidifex]MBB3978994.1 hypothetical protein [Mycoplana azooxidifex]
MWASWLAGDGPMVTPRLIGYAVSMDRKEIIKLIEQIKPNLEAEGVAHLALFGSRARGDNRRESDIDILIDVTPGSPFSLLNLVGVEHIVADATGLTSNAVLRRSLDEDFRKTIQADIVEIF